MASQPEDMTEEMTAKAPAPTPEADKAIIEQALKRFKLAVESEDEDRKEALDDFRFRRGKTEDHWSDKAIEERGADNTPCMVLNLIPSFIKQVTNEQRQQRPSPTAQPVGENSDPETAEIIEGMIRHIYNYSSADIAHDNGFDSSVTCGKGWWRPKPCPRRALHGGKVCQPVAIRED